MKWRRAAYIGVIFLGFLALLPSTPWLVIRAVRDEREIISTPLHRGEQFTICYTHSVDISPICEVFSVRPGEGIFLHETYFKMFGAGMGHWKGHGVVVKEGKWIKIKGIDRSLGRFYLRVGFQDVNHTLIIGDNVLSLSRLASGELVLVEGIQRPWILGILSRYAH